MTSIGLEAVNVGVPALLAADGDDRVWSGIAKAPVPAGTVLWLSEVNLAGDGQADLSVHGGREKAVYAYPSEHLGPWSSDLGEADLGRAPFGENLSTAGVLEADVRIGDVWRWGDARLEVCQPRWPCRKLVLHRGRADVQARMRATGRTGWYLRVLQVGEVPVDGPVEVDVVDPAGLTVADAHLAMADLALEDVARARAVVAHRAIAAAWRRPIAERLDRHEVGS